MQPSCPSLPYLSVGVAHLSFFASAVAETAPESIPEEKDNINGVLQLSREATAVTQRFSQQVLLHDGPRFDCGKPSPFNPEGKEQLAPVAYRYALVCFKFSI